MKGLEALTRIKGSDFEVIGTDGSRRRAAGKTRPDPTSLRGAMTIERPSAFGRRGFLQLAGTSGVAAGLGHAASAFAPQARRARDASSAPDRLDQGPFTIDQDEGWFTIATTTPSQSPVRNVGLGLIGYTWEENGPARAVREGRASLECRNRPDGITAIRGSSLYPLRLAPRAAAARAPRSGASLERDARGGSEGRTSRRIPGAALES